MSRHQALGRHVQKQKACQEVARSPKTWRGQAQRLQPTPGLQSLFLEVHTLCVFGKQHLAERSYVHVSTLGDILQEDRGSQGVMDPQEYGRERLAFVADTWKGNLDPAQYLTPGRHEQWTKASGKPNVLHQVPQDFPIKKTEANATLPFECLHGNAATHASPMALGYLAGPSLY